LTVDTTGTAIKPVIGVSSDTTICGAEGSVTLWLANIGDYQGAILRYTWSLGDSVVGNEAIYSAIGAVDTGTYILYISNGSCEAESAGITVGYNTTGTIKEPVVVAENGGNLCGLNSSAMLQVENWRDYSVTAVYQWYHNGDSIIGATLSSYPAMDSGRYKVVITDGGCETTSSTIEVQQQGMSSIAIPTIIAVPTSGVICGSEGSVLLALGNASAFGGVGNISHYAWYLNGNHVDDFPTFSAIGAEKAGLYTLYVTLRNGCAALSDTLRVAYDSTGTIAAPELYIGNHGASCADGGSVALSIINWSDYSHNATYQWYRNGVELGGTAATHTSYAATVTGIYKVVVNDGECQATFDSIQVTVNSGGTATIPVISSIPTPPIICGPEGSVLLGLSNAGDYSQIVEYAWYHTVNGQEYWVGGDPTFSAIGPDSAGVYRLYVSDSNCAAYSIPYVVYYDGSGTLTAPTVEVTNNGVICDGTGNVILYVTNWNTYSGVTYQWLHDGVAITGATGTTHTATLPGKYKVLITSGNCQATSKEDTVTITTGGTIAAPVIVGNPTLPQICGSEGTVVLSLENPNAYDTITEYVWFHNGDYIPGGNDPTYMAIGLAGNGDYRLYVSDGACGASGTYMVYYNSSGTITRPNVEVSVDSVVCAGGSILMYVSNGSAYTDATYQWYRNGDTIAGATNMYYAATASGRYKVLVSEGICRSVSLEDTLTFTTTGGTVITPVIGVTSDTTICGPSGSVMLSLSNLADYGGATLRYQWYHNAVYAGAEPTYSAIGTEGSGTYQLFVNAGCGYAESAIVVVRYDSTSTIVTPAVSVSNNGIVCEINGAVSLNITNTGAYTNPTYQWYRNGDTITDANLPYYAAVDSGHYKVVVTDNGCEATSGTYAVSISFGSTAITPVIAGNSSILSICGAEGSVLLTLGNASDYGASTLRYQWYHNDTLTRIEESTYSAIGASGAGTYRLYVSDGNCGAYSAAVVVTYDSTGAITTPIVQVAGNDTICGTTGSVLLYVSNWRDYGAASYQWYNSGASITGATLASYAATASGIYKVVITTTACQATSAAQTVTVDSTSTGIALPVIASDPGLQICGVNGSVALSLSNISDYTSPTYWWTHEGHYVGAEAVYLAIGDTSAGNYLLYIDDAGCGAVSAAVEVTYSPTSSIATPEIASSADSIDCVGGSISLYVTNWAVYGNDVRYQWYDGTTLISDATAPNYSATASGLYRVVVADATCQATSSAINVTIQGNGGNAITPVIAVSPSAMICGPNGSVLLSLANESDYNGASLRYFWYHNDQLISRTPTYSAMSADYAGTYKLHVSTDNCGDVGATVVVSYDSTSTIAKPVVLAGNNGVVCEIDGNVALYVTNISDYTAPAYQWFFNDGRINGATRANYAATDSGTYKVVITDSGCQSTSDTIAVTIRRGGTAIIPLITADVIPPSICGENGAITLSLTNSSDYPNGITEYIWFHGEEVIIGATGQTYFAEGTEARGPYTLYVSDGTCAAYSPTVVVLSDPGATIIKPEVISTNHGVACEPGSVALFVTNWSAYTNNATYQWYCEDTLISGATLASYAATATGVYRVVVKEENCRAVSDTLHVQVITGHGPAIVPEIASNPSNLTICGENGIVVLSLGNASAYGNATLHYEWFYDGRYVGSGPTYSATGDSSAGVYYLYVSDGTCGEKSQEVTVVYDSTATILKPELIAANNGVACATNGSVVLYVANWRDYPDSVTYNWYHNDVLQTGSSATLAYYNTTQSGTYKVVIMDGNCIAVSDKQEVTINVSGTATIPTIASYPTAPVICGDNGAVILRLGNRNSYTNVTQYLWLFEGHVVWEGPTYAATKAGRYYLFVADGNCGAVSGYFDVYANTNHIAQPEIAASNNGIVCESNSSVALYLTNTDDFNAATYQWYRNDEIISNPNAINAYYEATDSGTYKLVVTEGTCVAVSNDEQLTVQPGSASTITPIIAGDPTSLGICGENGAVVLYLGNRNTYADSVTEYRWFYTRTLIPGSGVPVGTEPTLMAMEPGQYILHVSAGGCAAYASNTATVWLNTTGVIAKPKIQATNNGGACETDGSVAIYITNEEAYTGATYQWYRNGDTIAGATQASYAATESGNYKVVVTEGFCKAVSDTVLVHIKPTGMAAVPTITGVDANGTPSTSICGDGGVITLFENSGQFDSTATYLWFKNGSKIIDSTQSSYRTEAGIDGAGTYYLHVVYNGCGAYSNPIVIDFHLDTLKPTLSCVDTIYQSTDSLRCDVVLDNIYRDSAIVVVDDCLSSFRVEWTNNGTDWSTDADSLLRHRFEKGQSTLIYKVIDASGNDSTCSVIIVVEDREAPRFDTLPPSITAACAADSALFPDSTRIILATAVLDNCSPSDSLRISYLDVISDSTCLSQYTITRKWTVTDLDGNVSDTLTQAIRIEDNIAPVAITLAGALDTAITCENMADTIIPMGWVPEFADNCGYPVRIELRVDDREEISSTEIRRVRHWVAIDTCGNESDPFIQTITFCGYYIDLTLTAVTSVYSNTDTAYIPESEFIEKRIDFDGWDLYLVDNAYTYIIAPQNLGSLAAEKAIIEMTFEPDAQRIVSTTGVIGTNTVTWEVYNIEPYSIGAPVEVRIQPLLPGKYANTFTIHLDTTGTVRREPIIFLPNNTVVVKVIQELWDIPNVIVSTDNENNALRIVELMNSDVAYAELTVYNRWGNQVYRNSHYEEAVQSDDISRLFTGQNLAKGTYYYDLVVHFKEATLPNGEKRVRPNVHRRSWVAILN
jgi:hypothetical protein